MPRRRRFRISGATVATALTVLVAGGGLLAALDTPGETVTVQRVIDGDTFVTDLGDRVRVLGIDSCERSDPAGPRATALAEELIARQTVTLTREPGVDRDRWGRELRYVETSEGRDLADAMVREDHTEVYAGRNDASDERVAALRAVDGSPTRDCSKR